MNLRRIIFWQNMLAFHQAAHIRELARMGYTVVWVTEEALSPEREAHGWSTPSEKAITVCVCPDNDTIDHLIAEHPANTTHIFSGIRGFALVRKAFLKCVRANQKIGILIENRDNRGIMGAVRFLTYWWDAWQHSNHISFLLVMGYSGQFGGHAWYRRCGYPEEKLFPYGYFVDGPSAIASVTRSDAIVEIIYIGQLIPRKGVDILLKALTLQPTTNWRLRIVGDGKSRESLMRLASMLNISPQIEYLPFMKNEAAMRQFASADFCVMPSRFDGWGVVGNEALLHGVPLLCSDRCGVQDLLGEEWRGEVFAARSVSGLARVLSKWIAKGKRTDQSSQRIHRWAKCISGASAAEFLDKVLHCVEMTGNRPEPEWM